MEPPAKTTVIDGRGLQPPEPFERVVAALAYMDQGDRVLLIVHHEPRPLYRFLEKNSYRWQAETFPDGHVEVLISED